MTVLVRIADLESALREACPDHPLLQAGAFTALTPREKITARLDEICATYGVTLKDLTGLKRGAFISKARRAAYVTLRELGLSLTHIGRILNRDHSTVLHGLKRAQDLQ